MARLVAIDVNARKIMLEFEYSPDYEDDVVAYARKELGNDIDASELEDWVVD